MGQQLKNPQRICTSGTSRLSVTTVCAPDSEKIDSLGLCMQVFPVRTANNLHLQSDQDYALWGAALFLKLHALVALVRRIQVIEMEYFHMSHLTASHIFSILWSHFDRKPWSVLQLLICSLRTMSSQKHKYWKCFQNYTTCFALKTQNNGKNYTFPTLFSVFHSLSLHSCCLEVRFDRHFCFSCKRTPFAVFGQCYLQPKLWYENKARTTQLLSTATYRVSFLSEVSWRLILQSGPASDREKKDIFA